MTTPGEDESDVYAAIADVLAGNPRAFAPIVTRYQTLVYRLALSYHLGVEEAEDATQEVFARVFRALPSFRLGRRFHPWLFTIAVNEIRSRRRRRTTLEARRARGVDTAALPDTRPDEGASRDTRLEIRAAVSRLPATLRDVVVLYYLEDMDVAETAQVLGLGPENVKSRLHRARGRLRALLGGG